jgi:hypothetical protein
MAVSTFPDSCSGLITATGFPRSVKTTSSPFFTALMAFENR